ncbi:MAG: efflux RND transporter permease subunit [Deltaproteobacteria bacterium]|nr:efflux RND transporter permease subunit [Deltaproteobacteria bacterium]
MWLSRLSIRKPVLVVMTIGFFVVFGLVSWPRLPVELLPDVHVPYLLVTVIYPGASPSDVENAVVLPLEDRLGRVGGLKKLRSTARADVGTVLLELADGTDLDRAREEVRGLLQDLDTALPSEAWNPRIQEVDLNAVPVLQLALSGGGGVAALTDWADDVLVPALSRLDGVALVELVGERRREVAVEVDQARLLAHHLTLGHVVQAVRSAGVDVPAGTLLARGQALPVRLAGAFRGAADVASVRIRAPTGEVLPLSAVADVQEALSPETTRARVQGRPALGVAVHARPGTHTVAVGEALDAELALLTLPPGVTLERIQDAAAPIRVSIRDLLWTLALCVVLTAGVLVVFLRDWRGTAIVALAMPASLVGALTFIRLSGFSLNYMTLMGLAITVGTLVDASIVVLESIAVEARTEPDGAIAADRGTGKVVLGVTGSIATNVVVFTPMAFMEGIVGRFFTQFAATIVYATLLSLLVSFTLTPMLAARLYGRSRGIGGSTRESGALARAWDRAWDATCRGYRSLLGWCLQRKAATLAALSAVLVATVMLLGPMVSLGWFTNPDQGFFLCLLRMPRDADLDLTEAAVRRAEGVLLARPEVRAVYGEVGRYRTLAGALPSRHRAELQVVLDPERAYRRTAEVMEAIRPHLSAAVPGAAIVLKELGGGETAVREDLLVEVLGSDPDALSIVADRVVEVLDAQPNLVDVDRSGDERTPEVRVRPDPVRLSRAGLTTADLGRLMRVAIEGDAQARVRRGEETEPVRVRLAGADRRDAASIGAITVQTASGAQVPVRELAEVEEVEGPSFLMRQDRARRVGVTANLAWGAIGDTAAAVEAALYDPALPEGITVRVGGEEEQRVEAEREIGRALALSVMLLAMLLAILLEDLLHPFTLLSTLPLGLVGVLVALAATGVDLDIFGMMALVMLVGIVVNNAILMLEGTRHARAAGLGLEAALAEGGVRRLRPILMTTLTASAGMLPLAFRIGQGSEIRQSMAIVAIGGLAVSSVLVLVAMPVVFLLVERLRARWTKGT